MRVLEHFIDGAKAAVTGHSFGRLQRRREIRKKIAHHERAKQKYLALQQRLTELDREAEGHADAHNEACASAQAELADLDSQYDELVGDRQPIPEQLETRRRELLECVQVANEQLTDAVDHIEKLRVPLRKAIREAGTEAAQGAAAENQLCSQELADPQLWCDHFAQSEIVKALLSLARYAESKAASAESLAAHASTDNENIYQARVPKWKALVAAIEPLRQAAGERARQLRQAMIDE